MSDDRKHTDSDEQTVSGIPTIKYYQVSYANSMANNDQKAVRTFKDFESREKLGRLRQELVWVRDGMVRSAPLNEIIGAKRRSRYGGYERWASLMLQWIAAAK